MSRRESYRTSHAYNSNSYNAGITKSSKTNTVNNTSNNDGGSQDSKLNYLSKTTYTPKQIKDAKAKVAADKKTDDLKRLNELQYEKPTGLAQFSPIAQGLHITGIGKKTFEINKSYFQKNVADKFINGKKSAYSNSPESFRQYMQDRGSGKVDAYGRTINNRDEGGGQLVQKNIGGRTLLTTTPTTAEVSQSKAAQVEDSVELKKKRIKAKGRSPTIMTGVTGSTGSLTLGKPSLLGT